MELQIPNNQIDLSSLDAFLNPEPENIKDDPTEAKYIINSKQIDTHTIKRSRVKLTPAVCDTCGFDVAKLAYEQNKLSTAIFDELPPEIQATLVQAVKKHKQLAHTMADNLIVSESQLKNHKKWLSGRNV